jgi:hypothetical protein
MPYRPSGKFRTNLTIAPSTYTWLKQHAFGERGMGELIDQLVLRERLVRPLAARGPERPTLPNELYLKREDTHYGVYKTLVRAVGT